ncbi:MULTISPECIES: hypothetical protein [Flavobacterium]|uniref:Uncharacterized protein n=1 Tax=Flavobacterium lipolyticum TaxID=2893754 RepID=A0ABS8LZT5_9FLAO|nr:MULTISPECIES: hypothetical protein [unclassified Flavobacterium]MCC9018097.1 hypothetical protein [Flavobacterium sp. F-126]
MNLQLLNTKRIINLTKKTFLPAIALIIVFTSCDNDNQIEDTNKQVNSENQIKILAETYGFTLENSNTKKPNYKKPNYNTSNSQELEVILKSLKTNFESSKIISSNDISKEDNLGSQKWRKILYDNLKNNQTSKNTSTNDDPPYKYSSTLYFDNSFPAANIAVRIDYNLDANGNVTESSVTTYKYGYDMAGDYSQTAVNITSYGNMIVFEAIGQFSTSVGLGSFSLNSTNSVSYTGYIKTNRGGSPTLQIWQEPYMGPRGNDDQNTPRNQ